MHFYWYLAGLSVSYGHNILCLGWVGLARSFIVTTSVYTFMDFYISTQTYSGTGSRKPGAKSGAVRLNVMTRPAGPRITALNI